MTKLPERPVRCDGWRDGLGLVLRGSNPLEKLDHFPQVRAAGSHCPLVGLFMFVCFLPLWLQAFPGFELPIQGVSVQDVPAGEASGSGYPGSPCELHSLACWDMKPRLGRLCPLRLSRALGGLGRELPGTFGLGPRPSSSFT